MSMMATTVATPVTRSWAQIAGGDSQNAESTQKSIKPAARGSLLRFCRGKVLTMLNQYGWLMLDGEVDHPFVEKHGGDVYIHKDDVLDGETPCPGDIVTFYLYVDDKGLGAEDCCVAQRADSNFNPNAPEFVPMNVKPASYGKCVNINTSAVECAPASALSKQAMCEPVLVDEVADLFLRLSLIFASADEEPDDDELDFDKPSLAKRAPSCNGSTSGGETSDSEQETFSETTSDSEEETSSIQEALRLPLHFRPPPGLSHPAECEMVWAF